jgi:ankyrin repeat protein
MKQKFFRRNKRDSNSSPPIEGATALTGPNEHQLQKKGSNDNVSVIGDSAHHGSVPVHRKANNLTKVPIKNQAAQKEAVPPRRNMLFGRKKNDSKSTLAVSQSAGLLALPGDVHITLLGDLLTPGDWARLAATCKRLKGIYSKKIMSYRDKLINQVFPPAVLSDELFKMYPIDYSRLMKVLKKSGSVIKMMASFGIKASHLAALLGMVDRLEYCWGEDYDKYPANGAEGHTVSHYKVARVDGDDIANNIFRIERAELEPGQVARLPGVTEASFDAWCDARARNPKIVEGYTELHYKVVRGDRNDVENHLFYSDKNFIHKREKILELAEIAAAAGSLDVLDMLSEVYGLNFNQINISKHMSLIHWGVAFDQIDTVKWLTKKGVETWRGENLLCFAAEHGRLGIFNYFLSIGLDTKPVDFSEHPHIGVSSKVHAACGVGNLALLKRLIVKLGEGCLKTTDIHNRTALHYGVMSDNMEIIECLVEEHHLSLSAEDAFGRTPLHVLAEAAKERPKLWLTLPFIAKKYGTEYLTEFRDKNRMSVKDYLESAGHPDILSVINAMCEHQHGFK